MNPLFPDSYDAESAKEDRRYLVPGQGSVPYGTGQGQPRLRPTGDQTHMAANPAAELVRRKLAALYSHEPGARQELAEVQANGQRRSKHQQFMYDLSVSGQSLAEIQRAWHNYYARLPDHEKHAVWQEFYAASSRAPAAYGSHVQLAGPAHHPTVQWGRPAPQPISANQAAIVGRRHKVAETLVKTRRKLGGTKTQILERVRERRKTQLRATQHLKSIAFGLGLGCLAVLIFLFGLFNQMVIAPLIRPGGQASAAPIIITADSLTAGSQPEVIIPKINVELPIVYDAPSTQENVLEKALESGVIHYPTTVNPGETGNAAYFGHSSNNIFNKGKYKFAFVLLHELEPGDLFYLSYNQKVYGYKVYLKRIVEPTDTWVLDADKNKTSTVTLITCDPPGTSRHRLVVWGEQISPEPSGNQAPATPPTTQAAVLPSDGPSLWSRFWNWLF